MEIPPKLTIELNDLIRSYENLLNSTCEEEFIRCLSNQEKCRLKWITAEDECRELQDKLDSSLKDNSILKNKLHLARGWIDRERSRRKKITHERNTYAQQLNAVRQTLLKDYYSELPDGAKKELLFLTNTTSSSSDFDDYHIPVKSNSASLGMLEISVTRSDLDLDGGHISLSKNPKSIPNYSSFEENLRRMNAKSPKTDTRASFRLNGDTTQHIFISRTFIMPESCTRCYRKIAFGRIVLKCLDCGIVVHPECRDFILSQCKSYSTLIRMQNLGFLADYVRRAPLSVPTVVMDCVNEIEHRGLHKNNLYRVLGARSTTQRLLNEMRYNKGTLNLNKYDTESICGALMNFLENLHEPLIPCSYWRKLIQAATDCDQDCDLVSTISELPRVNRDTLAFIMLHLQNIIKESNSSVADLAAVFSRVIFGRVNRLGEADIVVKEMILLPVTFWNNIADFSKSKPTSTPVNFQSANQISYSMMTPNSKKRFFNTSPPW